MEKPNLTSGIILGGIGLVFSVDTVLLFTGHQTISEVTTDWISLNPAHLVIFLSGIVLLITHFIYSKYQ